VEQLVGKQSNFMSLLDDDFIGGIRFRSKFRLVDLEVQAFKALDASDKFAF
jgi:hypothetical protein